jgi:hypothetical protein
MGLGAAERFVAARRRSGIPQARDVARCDAADRRISGFARGLSARQARDVVDLEIPARLGLPS